MTRCTATDATASSCVVRKVARLCVEAAARDRVLCVFRGRASAERLGLEASAVWLRAALGLNDGE